MPTRAAIKRMQMEFDFSFSPLHFPFFSSVFLLFSPLLFSLFVPFLSFFIFSYLFGV